MTVHYELLLREVVDRVVYADELQLGWLQRVRHHVGCVAGLYAGRELLDDVAGTSVRLDVRMVEVVSLLGREVADLLFHECIVIGVEVARLDDPQRPIGRGRPGALSRRARPDPLDGATGTDQRSRGSRHQPDSQDRPPRHLSLRPRRCRLLVSRTMHEKPPWFAWE